MNKFDLLVEKTINEINGFFVVSLSIAKNKRIIDIDYTEKSYSNEDDLKNDETTWFILNDDDLEDIKFSELKKTIDEMYEFMEFDDQSSSIKNKFKEGVAKFNKHVQTRKITRIFKIYDNNFMMLIGTSRFKSLK